MITEREVQEGIEQCLAEPIFDKKITRLAELFIIQDHLFGQPYDVGYSKANEVETPILRTNGDTEFLQVIDGKPTEKVLHIIQMVVDVVQTMHPKVYDRMMNDLDNL